MPYATRAQTYALGLPAAAFVCAPRTVESVDFASGVFTLRGHGLEADSPFSFSLQGSTSSVLGADAAALPTGLTTVDVYYAQPVEGSSDLFQISDTEGGNAVVLTDTGSGVFGIAVDRGPALDLQRAASAGEIDIALAAHGTPIPMVDGAYPPWLVAMNARLAASDFLIVHGLQNPLYADAAKILLDRVAMDREMLKRWANGAPVPGLVDATPAIVESGARSWKLPDRDWSNASRGGDLT